MAGLKGTLIHCYNGAMSNRLRRRTLPPSIPPSIPPALPPPTPQPPQPPVYVYVVRRNSPAEIITIAVLIAVLLLLGVGLLLWAVRSDLAFGPTPTPTATPGPPRSPTPDFGATRVAEDMLTQTARQALLMGTRSPTPFDQATPDAPGVLVTVELTAAVTLTPTPVTVMLPGVVVSPRTPVPTEIPTPPPTPTAIVVMLPIGRADSPLPTPTPTVEVAVPPTEMPTETPPPFVAPTETPTLTVVPPTPTPPPPTFTPTATPVYFVNTIRAFIRDRDATMRLGPSTIYTATGTIGINTEVQLLGRNRSGEWVYACCLNNQPGWVRQARARPDSVDDNPPEGVDADDVRWLSLQTVAPNLPVLPEVTPVPGEDYPLVRYTRDAQARLPGLPQPPLNFAWPAVAQASLSLISPAVVSGSSVVVASADNHLYSFDRTNGNQRWRINLGQPIRQSPAIGDGLIFVADETGRLIALQDRGNEAIQLWNTDTSLPPVTSFSVYSDTLFIGVGQGENYELLHLDRDNGVILHRYGMTGSRLRYPAVGDQLVYAAGGWLAALDVFTFETIWERREPEFTNITAGPVYSTPGVRRLAELYIVNSANRIFCLDANTGIELWSYDNGEPATGLAVNDRLLFVSGNGYVKAIRRDDLQQLWRVPTAGLVLEGVWADNSRVLALTQGGTLQSMEASTGSALGNAAIPAPAGGAGAVSGRRVFVPGSDGSLYALEGQP